MIQFLKHQPQQRHQLTVLVRKQQQNQQLQIKHCNIFQSLISSKIKHNYVKN
jgi:hypothetical protein